MKRLFRTATAAILAAGFAFAQADRSQARFEVASVKPTPPGAITSTMDGGPLPIGPFNRSNHNPDRITWSNIRLLRVIQIAYDFPLDRISGPEWLGAIGYDILAIVPMRTTVDDFRLMLQNLLAERFKVALHRETKEVSGYALEVAHVGQKLGPKLKESIKPSLDQSVPTTKFLGQPGDLMIVDETGFPAPRPGNPIYLPGATFEAAIRVNGMFRITGLSEAMPMMAETLGRFAGMPVENRTGLTGTYDFHLEYTPSPATGGAPEPPAGTPADIAAPAPDLFDAVQAQLGLKLVPKRVPVETLVIDHAEKVPTEN